MPINRYVLIPLALFALLAVFALQLTSAGAQQPAGITLTPTDGEQTATATDTEDTATPTIPVNTPTPTDEITVPPPPPDTVTPTGEPTIPPPSVTETPSSDDPGNRATRTPPVLPATGQSPIGGSGFPIEGIFAIILLALVGWFLLRGVTGARTQK